MSSTDGIETSVQLPPGSRNNVAKVTVNFIDPEGEVAISAFYVNYTSGTVPTIPDMNTAIDDLVSQFAALSLAQVQSYSWAIESFITRQKPPNPGNNIDNIEDKVFLEYSATAGWQTKMNIPMPDPAVFQTDGETVDPTVSLMTNWSTKYLGPTTHGTVIVAGSTPQASTLDTYVKGYYRRAKTRRRLRQGISTETGG